MYAEPGIVCVLLVPPGAPLPAEGDERFLEDGAGERNDSANRWSPFVLKEQRRLLLLNTYIY
jgi:hypothetical protein